MSKNPVTSVTATVGGAPAGDATHDRAGLRLAAGLLLGGQLLYILVTQFHAGGDANNHPEIFLHYAASSDWKGVHVAQFAAMAVLISGLLAFGTATNVSAGATAVRAASCHVTRTASALAGTALALYAALQAVDGVGNQQVDAAWAHATADKPARFASAEAMRWLEWGMRSYHDYALGLAVLLFAAAAATTFHGVVPKGVAALMGATGLIYLAQGWVVGQDGFSATNSYLIVVAWVLSVVWMVWMAVVANRGPKAQTRGVTHSR